MHVLCKSHAGLDFTETVCEGDIKIDFTYLNVTISLFLLIYVLRLLVKGWTFITNTAIEVFDYVRFRSLRRREYDNISMDL